MPGPIEVGHFSGSGMHVLPYEQHPPCAKIKVVARKKKYRANRWVSGTIVCTKLGLQAPGIAGKISAGRRSEYFAHEKSMKSSAAIFQGRNVPKPYGGKKTNKSKKFERKDLNRWINEIHIHTNNIYKSLDNTSLGYEYQYKNFDLVKILLFKGGHRLAEILNYIFD